MLFLSTFGVKIDVKNERKRVSRMCEIAYLSIKNPKASRALKRALDPSRRLLASLARLRFATSATFGLRGLGPPLDQILDPHLVNISLHYSGGFRGGAPGASPPRPKIFSISCSFSQNLVKSYVGAPLEGWRPLLRGILDPLRHYIHRG